MKKETENIKSSIPYRFSGQGFSYGVNCVKKFLQGDPHFVAMRLAIGVFVAATPSMPFQTAKLHSLSLAFMLSISVKRQLARPIRCLEPNWQSFGD